MLLSIADTFIKRPVLTTVCSILIVMVGAICLPLLPISQLPQLGNTEIEVTSAYIGADAQTTETTTTSILERQINGVENMKYMYSNSSNGGLTSIRVAFPQDVDRDIAQVNVQNRVAIAEPQLPASVKQTGVQTDKAAPNILLVLGFSADKDDSGEYIYDEIFVSNYLDLNVIDQLKRLPGVGTARILGERQYAMRIWLDPNKMAARGLIPSDVVNALQEQNLQVGAGKIGQAPAPDDQLFEIPLQAVGRFAQVSEFEELVVKVGESGSLVKIKDVGRVELGAQDYSVDVLLNGDPGVGIAVYQLPGSNALETATAIKNEMARLSQEFPPGLKMIVAYDTTLFIKKSLEEVVTTLFQAIGLVILILFVFLQDWRSTLVPAIAIPVALIGALAGLMAFGFEINTLTLFAFTLASGLVVDDAIVIVEAISSKISEGMQPRQAALDAMEELTGATIATSAVLMAVFIPVSFFPGTTGVIYKQFALTIAFAIACSTFNALTFSPTMSALLLRPRQEQHGPLAWLFRKFNDGFGWVQERYGHLIQFLTRINLIVIAVFIAGLVATVWMYSVVPSGFVPEEDQGYLIVIYQAPDGVSLNYTSEAAKKVEAQIRSIPEVEHTFGAAGFSFDGQDPSKGLFFVTLKPWSERPRPDQSVYGVLGKLYGQLATVPEVFALPLNAPPVSGMGSSGGFEFQLQDRTGNATIAELMDNANRLLAAVNSEEYPAVSGAFTQFTANKAQKKVEVFRDRAKALNVDVNEIFSTLQTYLGSSYVNDFVLGQRQYRVYVQAEGEYRSTPEDINQLYVRSRDGEMISLGNLIQLTDFIGPEVIQHFNIFRSIKIQGGPASGYSSGQAIAAMEQAAADLLDPGFGYSWQGTALEEKSSGGSAPIIFGLGFVMVFLVLAAQYESYVDPAIIMLSVPLSVLGALSAVWFRANIIQAGGVWPVVTNDVYCQVALVMLIGLASKNSILIVEFANQLHEKGLDFTKAATQAAEQRFRPIQMTAFSTLVGFWPLVTASGAGSSSRWSLGTAIFGGMLLGTVLSLVITPNLYIAVKHLEAGLFSDDKPKKNKPRGGSGGLANLSGLFKKPLGKNGHSSHSSHSTNGGSHQNAEPEATPEENTPSETSKPS